MRKFSRLQEDFTCEVCGHMVSGNGYTNHCSECFHSKHVDINPGDRASTCRAIMKPIAYETGGKKELVIVHECTACKLVKKNKAAKNDNLSNLFKLRF